MRPQSERRVRRALWGITVLLVIGSGLLTGRALAFPAEIPSLDELARTGPVAAGSGTSNHDLSALAKMQMSRTVVPPPPPPPPRRPAAPALTTLVRLTGVMDFGSSPPEAMIEIIRLRKTKSFVVGDTIEGTTAKIEAITDGVILAYDEKRWKLSFDGIKELPAESGTETGKSSERGGTE